jgi:4-hydroxy-tetrahydrodipicolinate reductase
MKMADAVPVFYSSNYSMGVQLFIRMLEAVRPYIGDWTAGIHEIHHQTKKDKPSGTAKRLQEALRLPVEITSQRLKGFPGEHTVILSQEMESITITHQAKSRVIFAEGVYRCAEFLLTCPAGWFTFDDFFSKGKG